MSSAKVTDLPSLGPHLTGGSLQATEAEPDTDPLLTFRPAPTLPLPFPLTSNAQLCSQTLPILGIIISIDF